jgi:gluconolactonase
MNRDGTGVTVVVETFEGKRLNSPNDIVVRSDGTAFFTDPPYGAPPDRPLDFQAVFALDRSGQLHKVADDFEKPNGLAFSPDERTLYVHDTGRYQIRAFDIEPNAFAAAGPGRIVATPDPAEKGGPDGMKVDQAGRIYSAVAQGVWVYEPDGTLLGILGTQKRPSNLAWCGPEANVLAITMVDEVYRIRLNTEGCRPPFQPR